MSTSYHPQSDGQTEVLNRCLECYLRCFAHEQPQRWSMFLSWAEYSYNTGYHTSTNVTPFFAVYGRPPPAIIPYTVGDTSNAELEQQLNDRDAMLSLLKQNLLRAQDRMRQQANARRREVSYGVNDYVFLKLQPYRQQSLARRRFEKLSPRFFGPYRIKQCIGPVAYELELPPDSRVHPIFHVSMLKQAHGKFSLQSIPPLPITKDWVMDVQPASVLDHRWVGTRGTPVLELLIQWSQRPVEEASWEPYDILMEQFPTFRLEDKASFGGGCNYTKQQPLKVYSRRQKDRQKDRTGEAGADFLVLTACHELVEQWGAMGEWGSYIKSSY